MIGLMRYQAALRSDCAEHGGKPHVSQARNHRVVTKFGTNRKSSANPRHTYATPCSGAVPSLPSQYVKDPEMKPTRIWIDCEWNGPGGDLLSMALVAEGDRYFYGALQFHGIKLDPWVADNVIPVLTPMCGDPHWAITREGALDGAWAFCIEDFLRPFDAVHIIADWPEDVARFCMEMITGPGRRINTPPLTFEVCRDDAPSKVPHNALWDARALRDLHLYRESAQ